MRRYTLAQLRLFTEAAERARRRQLAEQLLNLRASQMDPPKFRDYLKKLTD